MADADPARPLQTSASGGGALAVRVGSSLVLAPLALVTAYAGGWLLAVFWGSASLVVLWEWTWLVSRDDRRAVLIVGAAALVLAVALAEFGIAGETALRPVPLAAAPIILAMGMLAVAIIAPAGRAAWLTAAIPYAGAVGVAPLVLRADSDYGFVALILLFAVVWSTDIAAFFVGRAVGGPKLAPRFSPNKTWSGAIGGVAGALLAAIAVAKVSGVGRLWPIVLVAIALSLSAQAGDLFESAMKRRFGAKDSSRLIPGHGGMMDRVDGFVAAAVLACAIGIAGGGVAAPARGLLMW